MTDLTKYKTRSMQKIEYKVTSVSLEKRHLDFLQNNALNLSRMIRDFLDQIILENETEKTPKKKR